MALTVLAWAGVAVTAGAFRGEVRPLGLGKGRRPAEGSEKHL